jgi:hypothetical protein
VTEAGLGVLGACPHRRTSRSSEKLPVRLHDFREPVPAADVCSVLSAQTSLRWVKDDCANTARRLFPL